MTKDYKVSEAYRIARKHKANGPFRVLAIQEIVDARLLSRGEADVVTSEVFYGGTNSRCFANVTRGL